MRAYLLIATVILFAAVVAAQPQRPGLSGTVVAVNQQSDTVTLIDLKTMEAYRHVQVVAGPHEAAVSPDGRTVVVTNYNRQGFPYRVQFTPDGRLALIPHAQASSLVVADVAKQEIVKSIKLGLTKVAEPSTAGVFPHPDNRHVFVTVRNDNSMLVLDLVTGETLGRVTYSPVQR